MSAPTAAAYPAPPRLGVRRPHGGLNRGRPRREFRIEAEQQAGVDRAVRVEDQNGVRTVGQGRLEPECDGVALADPLGVAPLEAIRRASASDLGRPIRAVVGHHEATEEVKRIVGAVERPQGLRKGDFLVVGGDQDGNAVRRISRQRRPAREEARGDEREIVQAGQARR